MCGRFTRTFWTLLAFGSCTPVRLTLLSPDPTLCPVASADGEVQVWWRVTVGVGTGGRRGQVLGCEKQ